MSVYVDELPPTGWGRWNGGAHMICSDLEELHKLAKEIGLKRSWFQDHTFPHYDLTQSKRRKALAAGAIEIESGEIPDDVLMRCKDGSYETHGERKRRYRERRMQDV